MASYTWYARAAYKYLAMSTNVVSAKSPYIDLESNSPKYRACCGFCWLPGRFSRDSYSPIVKCISPNCKMYLSQSQIVFVPIALDLLWLLRLLPGRFSGDDLPKGRFCGRHIVHRKRPMLIFCQEAVHWVDCDGFTYWKEYPTVQGKRLHPGKQGETIAVFYLICLKL